MIFMKGFFKILSPVLFAVCVIVGCKDEKDISPEAQSLLDELNKWDSEALDIIECPNLHSGYGDLGETSGWIQMNKERLQKLGVSVRWNHEKMQYEVVSREEASSALCTEQPTSPIATPTTSLQGD